MKKIQFTSLILIFGAVNLLAQEPSKWSARMAATLMNHYPDSVTYNLEKPARWDYELGLYLNSIEQLWRQTGDPKYYDYIRRQMDFFIQNDGKIRTYNPEIYNIDHVAPGKPVLLLWQQTGQEKYLKAAQMLRQQLAQHPRTKEGGFWHKKRYPWQMWLDGLYMGEPFYAHYSLIFKEPQYFEDVANQFIWIEKNTREPKSGLLYHAWDESREQRWANKTTGQSPHFWGRAMGWYAMGLVDVLDYFPMDHPKYPELLAILQRLAEAAIKVQDAETGLWYQVLDKGNEPGNYLEASASNMFVYALLKGARLGYLDGQYLEAGKKGYAGILKEFVVQDTDGNWHLDKVCSVAGLGGEPYRDGSFEYYISEPVRRDDLKGASPFILASIEMERLDKAAIGKGKTVLLDRYFNNEYRNGARFHYTWEDQENSGFSWWGQIFRDYGAKTASLDEAPSTQNLKKADVFIIVDPDTRKETAKPNVMEMQHVKTIQQWVKDGGTLILLANDSNNCELPHFNQLAAAFGIQFSNKSRNMVKNNQFEQGAVTIPMGNPVFQAYRKLYIKELSTLELKAPAQAILTESGDDIMAVASYGKGRVFALGDPWLYNEYVDGKKLPADFDNFGAASDLAAWALGTPFNESAEAAEVASAVETLRKAMISADQKVLEKITAKQLTYGHSSGKTEDQKAFVDQLVSGRSVFKEINLTDQTITVTGQTAIVRHTLSAATNDAGKGPGQIRLSILLVWIKENGDWKLLARQAIKLN
jgi:unsaturated rhamnogalacturonyl hydrolase